MMGDVLHLHSSWSPSFSDCSIWSLVEVCYLHYLNILLLSTVVSINVMGGYIIWHTVTLLLCSCCGVARHTCIWHLSYYFCTLRLSAIRGSWRKMMVMKLQNDSTLNCCLLWSGWTVGICRWTVARQTQPSPVWHAVECTLHSVWVTFCFRWLSFLHVCFFQVVACNLLKTTFDRARHEYVVLQRQTWFFHFVVLMHLFAF